MLNKILMRERVETIWLFSLIFFLNCKVFYNNSYMLLTLGQFLVLELLYKRLCTFLYIFIVGTLF